MFQGCWLVNFNECPMYRQYMHESRFKIMKIKSFKFYVSDIFLYLMLCTSPSVLWLFDNYWFKTIWGICLKWSNMVKNLDLEHLTHMSFISARPIVIHLLLTLETTPDPSRTVLNLMNRTFQVTSFCLQNLFQWMCVFVEPAARWRMSAVC